jgi:NDP-sugar pyrophosphorylase family protein
MSPRKHNLIKSTCLEFFYFDHHGFISSYCSRASDFGLVKIDETGQIRQFLEKPKGENLKSMVCYFICFSLMR